MIATLATSLFLSLSSTCYTPYSSGSIMADGSHTRFGSVAMNTLPLGSMIRIVKPKTGFYGRKVFHVRDRIGYGSQLDFWIGNGKACSQWGRRTVVVKVLRRGYGRR